MSDHPITPPPELVREWIREANHNEPMFEQVAKMGAAWGADRELEEICSWLELHYPHVYTSWLRRSRRPKLSNLKEQALQALENADGADYPVVATVLTADQHALIRRALEELNG